METKTTTEELGRFDHHPDPAIDFCIEVECLQSRLINAKLGFAKMGDTPETIAAVRVDIERAMQFTVGGDRNAVDAKQLLRELERAAIDLTKPQAAKELTP